MFALFLIGALLIITIALVATGQIVLAIVSGLACLFFILAACGFMDGLFSDY